MNRLIAVAITLGWLVVAASAQRGGGSSGGHGGGFSGFHGGSSGFSAPRAGGGFSSFHGGFSGPRGGFSGLGPSRPFPGGYNRYPGVPRTASGTVPYRNVPGSMLYRYAPGTTPSFNHITRPGAPLTFGPRMPYQSRLPSQARLPNTQARLPNPGFTRPRAPYHSPNGGDRNNWYNHGGDNDRGDHHGWHHDGWHHGGHYYYVGYYVWGGVPLWYGWGYPYLSDYMYYPGVYGYGSYYDSPAAQPYTDPSAGPYNPPPDQNEPDAPPSYTPWPYSAPAPSSEPPAAAAVTETAPVTLVFKDGRPREHICNYLLTSKTLSVLDQHRRDIPVDQIDLPATAAVNREAGVEFALPGSSR